MKKRDLGDRERILGAVRDALKDDVGADRPQPGTPALPRFGVDHLVARMEDGGMVVARIDGMDEVVGEVARRMREWGLGARIAVSDPSLAGLDWEGSRLKATVKWDERLKAALTLTRGSIAETGQVLVSGESDEARFSLLADTHFAIVDAADTRPSLDDLGDMLGGEPVGLATLVAGPSRTADIEQTLVMGAHGPRRVCALLLGGRQAAGPSPAGDGRAG